MFCVCLSSCISLNTVHSAEWVNSIFILISPSSLHVIAMKGRTALWLVSASRHVQLSGTTTGSGAEGSEACWPGRGGCFTLLSLQTTTEKKQQAQCCLRTRDWTRFTSAPHGLSFHPISVFFFPYSLFRPSVREFTVVLVLFKCINRLEFALLCWPQQKKW